MLSSEQQHLLLLCQKAKEGNPKARQELASKYSLTVWTVEQLAALQFLLSPAFPQVGDLPECPPHTLQVPLSLDGRMEGSVVVRELPLQEAYSLISLLTTRGIQLWLLHEGRPMFNLTDEELRTTIV